MKPLVTIGLTAGILAGLWTQFSTPFGLITWVGFLSWACFFAAGGKRIGLLKNCPRQPHRCALGRSHRLGSSEHPHPRDPRHLRRHRSLRDVRPGTLERAGLHPGSVRRMCRILRYHLRRRRDLPGSDRRSLPRLALRLHRRTPYRPQQEGAGTRPGCRNATCRLNARSPTHAYNSGATGQLCAAGGT
jgi:hypothetical protein